MTNRITTKDLEAVVNVLNTITDSPKTPYSKTVDSKIVANIGNYHLSWAYGGVQLVRMSSEGGGITDILRCGFTTKKELYRLMHAFITGLENKREAI